MRELKKLKDRIIELVPEIKDKDINFEDVLVAIDKVNKEFFICVNSDRIDKKILISREFADILKDWKFRKCLDNQEKEIIDLLNNILCKENISNKEDIDGFVEVNKEFFNKISKYFKVDEIVGLLDKYDKFELIKVIVCEFLCKKLEKEKIC